MIDQDGQSSLASFEDFESAVLRPLIAASLLVIEAAQIRLIAHSVTRSSVARLHCRLQPELRLDDLALALQRRNLSALL
jgi:hypothetical protein